MYAQGVGLGAAKAREIGKFSEGYSGYVQQAQEAVSGTTGVLEAYPRSCNLRTMFSTPLVHVRLANVMEAEVLKNPKFLVFVIFPGLHFCHFLYMLLWLSNSWFKKYLLEFSLCENDTQLLFPQRSDIITSVHYCYCP